MIQRVQSVYLFLATVCVALMYVFPFAEIDAVTQTYTFDHKGIFVEGKNVVDIPYSVVIGILASYSFISIFLYKKLALQLRMSRMNFLLHVILNLILFFSADGALKSIPHGDVAQISYQTGFYLASASIAFLILASRSIKKDINLLRSLDRLR